MLCLTCGRVRPAAEVSDYTLRRARLIEQHGLCVCVQVEDRPKHARPTEDVELSEPVI